MEKSKDKRTQKTYQALIEAMFSLLEDKHFDDISVLDICEEAKIHRTTFYKHFEDKYHFFEFCIEALYENIFPSFAKKYISLTRKDYLMSIIHTVLDALVANKNMIKLIIEVTHSSMLTDVLHKALSTAICKEMDRTEKAGITFLLPIEMLGEYYAGAFISLLKWWLFSGTAISKETLTGYLDMLIDQGAYSITDCD